MECVTAISLDKTFNRERDMEKAERMRKDRNVSKREGEIAQSEEKGRQRANGAM